MSIRRAAVLIPLCYKEGVPAVLFTVRSQLVSTHKGQVSFPGGHCEEGESAPIAALRETREELGEEIGEISLVARCTAMPAITGTVVQAVVGLIHQDIGPAPHPHLRLSETEVERVFALTIDQLYDLSLRGGEGKQGRSGKWPVFRGDPGGAEVWGLTAFLLDSVLREIVTPLRQHRQIGEK